MEEGARIEEAAAAYFVREYTVVMRRSVRTRLTGHDSFVEPEHSTGRFQGRSDERVAANSAAVERATGSQVGGRGGTTLQLHEISPVAKCARTEMKEGQPGD